MNSELPKGFLGAALGAVAATAIARTVRVLAVHLGPAPFLPGAELAAHDSKAATFAETGALLIAVPVLALFFGRMLPSFLETRSPRGRLSFEWIALGAGLWLPLWRRGVPPRIAILASFGLALLIAVLVFDFRRSARLRRLFARRSRGQLFQIAFAGAAWDLARRSRPSQRFKAVEDILTEVLLCAVVFSIIAALATLRAGRYRVDSSLLARVAGATPLCVCFSALALVFWRSSPLLLTAALLTIALPLMTRWSPRIRHGFGIAALGFSFSCGLTIYYQPHAPIDLFEDGHSLSYAQAYAHGATPYLHTSPIHGWGYDGGLDGFVFRLTGPSLQAYRVRSAFLAALTLCAVAAACFAAFASAGWSALALLLTLSVCPFVSERQLLPFGGLALLAWGWRSGRNWASVLAGIFAGWEIFLSLDLGLILVIGGGAGILLRSLLASRFRNLGRGPIELLEFLAGATLGSLPLLMALATQGALSAFFRLSFLEVLSVVSDTWGLPAVPATDIVLQARTVGDAVRLLAGDGPASGFLPIVLAIAGTALLFRAARGPFDDSDSIAWLFFAVACIAARGVLGRADSGHFALYGLFGAIPIVWLIRWTVTAHPRALAFFMGLLLLLFTRLHPLKTLDIELGAVSRAATNRAALAATSAPVFQGGHASVPRDQAAELKTLKKYLDARLSPKETFFDFSNEPGLYFCTGREMPVRFLGIPFYERLAEQKEVIGALERGKPPLAILASGTWFDSPDGVPNRVRVPVVAQYLDSHYVVIGRVSRWTIAARR